MWSWYLGKTAFKDNSVNSLRAILSMTTREIQKSHKNSELLALKHSKRALKKSPEYSIEQECPKLLSGEPHHVSDTVGGWKKFT